MGTPTPVMIKGASLFLFEPDIAEAIQYADHENRKLANMPEKKLMWAVLEQAFLSLQDEDPAQIGTGSRSFRETQDWIMERDRAWLFSFENICAALELNPDYIRRRLLQQRRSVLNRLWPGDHSGAGPGGKSARKRKYRSAA